MNNFGIIIMKAGEKSMKFKRNLKKGTSGADVLFCKL